MVVHTCNPSKLRQEEAQRETRTQRSREPAPRARRQRGVRGLRPGRGRGRRAAELCPQSSDSDGRASASSPCVRAAVRAGPAGSRRRRRRARRHPQAGEPFPGPAGLRGADGAPTRARGADGACASSRRAARAPPSRSPACRPPPSAVSGLRRRHAHAPGRRSCSARVGSCSPRTGTVHRPALPASGEPAHSDLMAPRKLKAAALALQRTGSLSCAPFAGVAGSLAVQRLGLFFFFSSPAAQGSP
ncbi:homeobox protein cut-like 1 [Cavia porcellus]|uniref:homeobox protein cut-like 1 n=1 Tax=Cavia porcellus TaxID=10141 RepID=UPI002FDF5856